MSTAESQRLQGLDKVLLYLVGALFFVLPIPHTIAVRNILLLALLLVLGGHLYRRRAFAGFHAAPGWKWLIAVLILLTLWLLFQAAFLSLDPRWSLNEVKGQWLTAMVAFATATLLGRYAWLQGEHFERALFSVIVLVLLVHVLFLDFYAFHQHRITGQWPLRIGGLAEGPPQANYLTNLLLAFLLAESILRLRYGRRVLFADGSLLLLGFVAAIPSIIFENLRNGELALVGLVAMAALLALRHNPRVGPRLKRAVAGGLVILLLVPTLTSMLLDSRWRDLMDTVPIALDTAHHRYWRDMQKYPRPRLPDGREVSLSNYLRIAFLKEGLRLVGEYPLGVGYGRKAFSHGIRARYGDKGALEHSHSALLEMAIGGGIPGLLTWLAFLGLVAIAAWRTFWRRDSYPALLLLLYGSGFFVRSIVDFNTKNHVLMTFFFIVGLATMLLFQEREAPA